MNVEAQMRSHLFPIKHCSEEFINVVKRSESIALERGAFKFRHIEVEMGQKGKMIASDDPKDEAKVSWNSVQHEDQ